MNELDRDRVIDPERGRMQKLGHSENKEAIHIKTDEQPAQRRQSKTRKQQGPQAP